MATKKSTEENIPMTWEDAVKAKAQEQALRKAALASGPKYISFKSGVLSIDKIVVPNNELEIVVLSFIAENAYYKGRFNPDVQQTPVCWSVYESAEDMIPNEKSKELQAKTCESCPKFKWGSDPMGGRGKACKTRYRIAAIPATFNSVEDPIKAELRFGTLPVTSGKDFTKYLTECEMLLGLPCFAVRTLLKVTPDAKTQFKVSLEPLAPIDSVYMENVFKRVENAEKEIAYDYFDKDEAEQEPPKNAKI